MHHLAAPLAQANESTTKAAITAGEWIAAALIVILTLALVVGVRYALRNRNPVQLAQDPGVRTRVRLMQRMTTTVVVLFGLALAAGQLGLLRGLASTVLAGSAIFTVIVGFAARATLANALGGVVLTITQPVRVGDQVQIGEHSGVVEDVTLSTTILRTALGTLVRVPNEYVTQSVIYNETFGTGNVIPEATVLLPFGARVGEAIGVILEQPGVTQARLIAVEADGWNRLAVRGEPCAPGDRFPAEARMRLAVLDALAAAGLLAKAADAPDAGAPAQDNAPRI